MRNAIYTKVQVGCKVAQQCHHTHLHYNNFITLDTWTFKNINEQSQLYKAPSEWLDLLAEVPTFFQRARELDRTISNDFGPISLSDWEDFWT